MTEPKPRLSRFSIGRLYNLGNFEHVRYELTVEVPPECSAKDAFINALQLLQCASPHRPCSQSALKEAREALAKNPADLSNWERGGLDSYKKLVEANEVFEHNRKLALEALDRLGGTVEYKDAKADWEDDEP